MHRSDIRLDKADLISGVRIDAVALSTKSKAVRTPQGFLRAPIYATRTGVFTYLNPDGSIRRELRHPEDVFDPASLATLAGIPIVNDHPNKKNPDVMLITPENSQELMIGYTGDMIEAEGDYVAGWATITDKKGIEAVESGKQELSCGYKCEREEVPGEYMGLKYDVRQRKIVYNHLALVDQGRAGANVRLRLDSADAVQVEYIKPEENLMEKVEVLINGVKYMVDKNVADAMAADQNVKASAHKAALDAEKTRADRAEGRFDSVNSELTKAKDQLAARVDSADPKIVRAAAKKTSRILKVAERVLPKVTLDKADDMTDKDLMIECLKVESPKISLDGKSDDYIEARFDQVQENLESKYGIGTTVGDRLLVNRTDNKDEFDPIAAQKRQREYSENAWKGEKKA